MPDPNTAPPTPNVNVNVGDGAANNGFMGLTGWTRTVAQFSAIVMTYALAAGFLIWMVRTMREDRQDDRTESHQLYREMNEEQNRRAGEIKGAVDKNTEVMRALADELRQARQHSPSGHAPPPTGLRPMTGSAPP
jgi:uncharacterized protein HemX